MTALDEDAWRGDPTPPSFLGTHTLRFRPAGKGDRAWVCSVWRDSLLAWKRGTRRQCHAVANALYGQSTVVVAEALGPPDVLVGFGAVIDGEIVWLFVSREFRRLGIARQIKEALGE